MTQTVQHVALVTGGSRGLGRALTEALTDSGWLVVTDARRHEDLAGLPATVTAVSGDVTDDAHRRLLADTVAELGRLDLLVNNASDLGPSPLPTLERYPLDDLRAVYETDVLAPLALIQLLLPLLRESHGTVIDISSDAAVEAYPGWGGYGSAKAALDRVSAVLAAEEPDLHVYAVDPGDMRTDMYRAAFPDEDISDRPEPATVTPALLRLIFDRPASGRLRAADLLPV